jgi:hypothetical protein
MRGADLMLDLMLLQIKKLFRCLDGRQSVRIAVLIIGGLQVGFWLYLFFVARRILTIHVVQHEKLKI